MPPMRMALCVLSCLVPSLDLISPPDARAESFAVSTTISTGGAFFCVAYAECFGAGGNSITIPSGDDSATVTFTGVDTTFDVTNTLTTVTLGRFDVTATEGFRFPTNSANPELSIFGFRLIVDSSSVLFWTFGPGGGTTLAQRGPWDFSVPLDNDPFPYTGVNYKANSPVLEANASTLLTADVGLVPEPSTMILIGTGLAGAALRRRLRSFRL
jgi:hypothetical protein